MERRGAKYLNGRMKFRGATGRAQQKAFASHNLTKISYQSIEGANIGFLDIVQNKEELAVVKSILKLGLGQFKFIGILIKAYR
jgi:hypothetical protein